MRINQLEELRLVHREIKNQQLMDNTTESQKKQSILWEAVKKIQELSNLARREGLLALEEEVLSISLESEEEVLRQLVCLMLDGTEAEVIEEISMARYYANLCEGYQALCHLIYLEGVLGIQAGDNPRILEEKIKSMLPLDMYRKYSCLQEQKFIKEEKERKEHLIDNLCKAGRGWNLAEKGYYIFKLLDYVICDMKDRDLQRAMREIDNMELTLAMKRLSGEARRHIFDNLSERLGTMIAEDMGEIGPVRITDIMDASQKIINVIIRLLENGEISGRYCYLEPFYSAFCEDTGKEKQKSQKMSQLKEIIAEYEEGSQV